jgi:outer membrane protein assembly factor BamB
MFMRVLFMFLFTCGVCRVGMAQTPTVKWYLDLKDESFGQTYAKDVDHDGKLELFFSTYRNDGYIYCLNAEDGSVKWKQTFPGEVGACMDAGSMVFDSANNGVYKIIVPGSCNYSTKCLNALTGAQIWSTNIEGSDSPPSLGDIDGDGIPDLLIGNFVGYEYCLNPFTGAVKWRVAVDTVDAFICVNTEPVMVQNSDGLDFVVGTAWATNDGALDQIACYKGSDHSLKWRNYVPNTVYEGAATGDLYHNGKKEIIVGDWDANLYNINADNGTINWQVKYGSSYMSAVTLADVDNDGYLNIIYNDISTLYVLRPDSTMLWSYSGHPGPLRGSVVADINNDKYPDVTFATQDGFVISLSGKDGSVIRSVDMNALYGTTFNMDNAPVIADFDGDGILDLFVVGGYSKYPDTSGNYGRAYCFSWGVGKGPAWTIFRHDDHRTGCLCDSVGLPLPLVAPSPNSSGQGISVFPNPASNSVNIIGSNISAEQVTISITDIAGRVLMQKEVNAANANLNTSLDITTLSAGLYFVILKTDTEQYVSKIVKE